MQSAVSEVFSFLSIPFEWLASFFIKLFAFLWMTILGLSFTANSIPVYIAAILLFLSLLCARPKARLFASVAILMCVIEFVILALHHADGKAFTFVGSFYIVADVLFTYLWYSDTDEVPLSQWLLTFFLAPVFALLAPILSRR